MRILLAAALLVTLSTAVHAERGVASYYTTAVGPKTASGQPMRDGVLRAAHKSLPFGTLVRVTNNQNGRSTVVCINDRGPFVRGRVIDLTRAAKNAIGMGGVAPVQLEIIARGNGSHCG